MYTNMLNMHSISPDESPASPELTGLLPALPRAAVPSLTLFQRLCPPPLLCYASSACLGPWHQLCLPRSSITHLRLPSCHLLREADLSDVPRHHHSSSTVLCFSFSLKHTISNICNYCLSPPYARI